jgi:hypothetical protein
VVEISGEGVETFRVEDVRKPKSSSPDYVVESLFEHDRMTVKASDMDKSQSYLKRAQNLQNMSPEDLREWKESDLFEKYADYHDENVDSDETAEEVVERNIDVAEGTATEEEAQESFEYLSRAIPQETGDGMKFKNQEGEVVRKKEAADLGWGYDRTGMFS